jgi:hypothetical protein
VTQPADPAARQYAAVMAAYQVRTQALRADIEARVRRLWRSLGSYRNADQSRFAKLAVPIILGGQQAMSALTAANLAQQKQISVGGRFKPAAVDLREVTGAAARNGADPSEVYGRPFHLVWRQLDELPRVPGAIEQAIDAGEQRAVELALDDQQLAKQHTALEILGHDDAVVGYRRVLEGAHSCGLCIVASTQRYHREQLLPLHGGCDCSVAAIWGDQDPGRTIEATARIDGKLVPIADLPDVHDRIYERFGRSSSAARDIPGTTDAHGRILQYRDVLITHAHGELGPVLAVRGADFTGPTDLTK